MYPYDLMVVTMFWGFVWYIAIAVGAAYGLLVLFVCLSDNRSE